MTYQPAEVVTLSAVSPPPYSIEQSAHPQRGYAAPIASQFGQPANTTGVR